MESHPLNSPPDVEEKVSAFNSKFRTPRLPPLEELQLLKVWELVLELVDFEVEVLKTYGPTVQLFDLFDGKRIEKEGANLVNALRKDLAASASAPVSDKTVNTAPPKRPLSKANKVSRLALQIEETNSGQADQLTKGFLSCIRDDHPDEVVSRYLLQQDLNVDKCFARCIAAVRWRVKEKYVDELIHSGEEGALIKSKESENEEERQIVSGFLRQCRMGKTFVRGVDWEGRPVVITRMRLHHSNDQPLESTKRYILWQIEAARLMRGPAITDVVQLYDYTGAKAENTEIAPLSFMDDIFRQYYPRTLGLLIIHKAPKLFEGTWKVIKGILPASVVDRVRFTRTVEDLEQFIPRQNIIKELGGDDDWEFEYVPIQPDENRALKDSAQKRSLMAEFRSVWAEFEDLTRTMIKTAKTGLDYSNVKQQRDECVDRLRASYWMLDPYVRARTNYDRIGAIGFRRESALLAVKLTYGRNLERLAGRPGGSSIAGSSDLDGSSGPRSSTTGQGSERG